MAVRRTAFSRSKPFVGFEGGLEFTLPTPQSAGEGIPVIQVNARERSAKCSRCGNRMIPEENRQLHCPSCKHSVDRDVNAARNILALGLRFRHEGSANEAMVLEPAPAGAVIQKVDADQLTQQTTS